MNPRKMRKYGMRGFTKNVNRKNKQLEERVKELEDMVNILMHTVAVLCEDMMEGE